MDHISIAAHRESAQRASPHSEMPANLTASTLVKPAAPHRHKRVKTLPEVRPTASATASGERVRTNGDERDKYH
jgi:hypothetical protein